MDSSNSDSFGSFGVSGGAGGASGSGVIASGSDSGAAMPAGISSGGPVVIGGGMQEKKGKKWVVVVVLLVIFAAVAVGVTMLLLSSKKGGNEVADDNNANFHGLLVEYKEPIENLVSSIKYVYGGQVSINDFMVGSQEELSSNVSVLDGGISAIEKLNERLISGPRLSGTVAEIDLATNYDGLKSAIADDMEKYRNFVGVTTGLYQVLQNPSSAQEVLAEYGTSGMALASEIQAYSNSRIALANRYSENNCANTKSVVCDGIAAELLALQEGVGTINSAIMQVYIDNVGEINYGDNGSIMYYFDNLYVATEKNDAS